MNVFWSRRGYPANLQDGHHINNVNKGEGSRAPGPGADRRPPPLNLPLLGIENKHLLFKPNPDNGSIYTSWTMLGSPDIRQISSFESDITFHLCKLHENSIRDGSRGENCLSNFFCLWFMLRDLVLISAPSSRINNRLLIGRSRELRPLIGCEKLFVTASWYRTNLTPVGVIQFRKIPDFCAKICWHLPGCSSPECRESEQFYKPLRRQPGKGNLAHNWFSFFCRPMSGDLWATVPQPLMWLGVYYPSRDCGLTNNRGNWSLQSSFLLLVFVSRLWMTSV